MPDSYFKHIKRSEINRHLRAISSLYKGFNIVLGHISRGVLPYATPPAPCGVLFLVAMRMEC